MSDRETGLTQIVRRKIMDDKDGFEPFVRETRKNLLVSLSKIRFKPVLVVVKRMSSKSWNVGLGAKYSLLESHLVTF